MSRWSRRKVTPEIIKLAKEASAWASSPEGINAAEQSVVLAKETAQIYKDAQRRGTERIADAVRRFGIE